MENRRHSISEILNGKSSFTRFALNANPGVPVIGPTPNQNQLSYDNGILSAQINAPDWFETVYGLSGGYNFSALPVIPILTERLGRRVAMDNKRGDYSARKAVGRLGQFTRYVLGEYVIQAITASAATSGPNIVITWTDPTYQWFRNSDRVQNNPSANVMARVISPNNNAGSITIAPNDDNTPLNISDWNVAGQVVNMIDNAQPYSSTGRVPIFQIPYPTVNQTQTLRETVQINRMDDYLTYAKTAEGRNWIRAQYDLAVLGLIKQIGKGALWSNKGIANASNNPTRTYMGLDPSVGDPVRGGVYVEQFSSYTANDFENYWALLANKRHVRKNSMVHVMGRPYLTLLQNAFTSAAILPVGKNNTLERIDGNLIKGLDAYTYAISGVEHVFILDPALDDPEYSNTSVISGVVGQSLAGLSCYTIDLGSFMDAQERIMVPTMERMYFGEKMMRVGILRGLAENPFFAEGMEKTADYMGYEISTSQDNNTAEILIDTCIDFMASHFGCHKPAF